MQRVRIGLTGLAFVFLLVLLAAIATSPTSETPITANSLEQGIVNGSATQNAAGPQEPLAELGVAPRNPTADRNETAPPAAPAR